MSTNLQETCSQYPPPPVDITPPADITRLLRRWTDGDTGAAARVLPLVYGDLRRIAAGFARRERPDHTLQPTALVHEAYLELFGEKAIEWKSRAHFLSVAARVMRHILVDHSRRHGALNGAVQYAHRHLLVHRDLKPSNILVTKGGVPKSLRRHRVGVAAALAVVLLGAVFAAIVARQSDVIVRERRHAQEIEQGLTELLTADPDDASRQRLAATEVLDVAVPRLRAEMRDPAAEAALLDALGQVYHQAGLTEAARDLLEDSMELRRASNDAERGLSTGLHNLGAVVTSLGEAERGEELLRGALEMRRAGWGDRHPMVAETQEALALARWTRGDYEGAEALLVDAVDMRDDVCPAESNYWVTEGLSHLAALYAETGRLPDVLCGGSPRGMLIYRHEIEPDLL